MNSQKYIYELDWQFERRVATQHLGALKYTTSAKALCELIANGFDAGASLITVSIKENDLGGVESIIVKDNGNGISPDVLKERFISVGVFPQKAQTQFAKFGIGRSDEGFKKIIVKHREKAGLTPLSEDKLDKIKDVKKIPDLFLCAQKEYPITPKNHHLLVEIKAPKVPIGKKERDQVTKYAETIRKSHEFDAISTRWDLFVVSSKVSDDIDDYRKQKDKEPGILFEWENMTIWAFEWSEIITRAKEEMQFVKKHLDLKTKQLAVSDYLRKKYPEVFQSYPYQNQL